MQVRYQLRHSPVLLFLPVEVAGETRQEKSKCQIDANRRSTAPEPRSSAAQSCRHSAVVSCAGTAGNEKVRRNQDGSGGPAGGAEGTRTPDPLHAMQVRYQLRHSPGLLLLFPSFLRGLPRSNSNILEQQFRKFQIGNIHSPHTFTARARPTRCRLLRRLWRMRRPRAAGPPRGNPSRAAPVRRTPGPPHAGRG